MSIEVLEVKLESLHRELAAQGKTLNRVSDSLAALARVEERQMHINDSLARAFTAIEKLDNRIGDAEARLPGFSQTSVWVERAVIAIVAALGMFVAKQVGLI